MAGHRVTTRVRGDAGVGVVAVAGDMDIAAVADVRRALAGLEEGGAHRLALDLREVVHLDSSGLRVLLDAATRSRERGHRLAIVAPPEGPVGRLLELTLLSDELEVVGDLTSALR